MKIDALKELDRIISEGEMPEEYQIVAAFCETISGAYKVAKLVEWACSDDIRAMGAAMELTKAVLPGCRRAGADNDQCCFAEVRLPEDGFLTSYNALHPSPARALLLATIRALIAEETTK